MVISGEEVCCSAVFGTLVRVSLFSFIWLELLMTSVISCPQWSSVYECQRVEWAFTSPVRTEWYVCEVLYAVLYVCVKVSWLITISEFRDFFLNGTSVHGLFKF